MSVALLRGCPVNYEEWGILEIEIGIVGSVTPDAQGFRH